jgi:hypothetical protein
MSCSRCGGCGKQPNTPLTHKERQLLELLAENAFLPVARFLLRSRENPEMAFVMSAPVYLHTKEDTASEMKETGRALLSLQKRRLITIDYDIPLSGFDYQSWESSDLYQQFTASASTQETEPVLEGGSIALTLQGQETIDFE